VLRQPTRAVRIKPSVWPKPVSSLENPAFLAGVFVLIYANMKDLENEIRRYLTDRNWLQLKPADVAKSISIEAAELLEHFQWDSSTVAETLADQPRLEEIKKELADVMIYCLDMSIILGLDAKQIILDKLKLVKEKYPA
jgi:NTP pyrophosphatase (non-canonical NTP hydrolase)